MTNKYDRNRAYSDIKDKLKILTENLEELSMYVFYKKSSINLLKEYIKNEVDIIAKSIEELKNPFLLFILGCGKYGKTTLINSLIEDDMLKIDDIPNTWKLDTLIKSEKDKIDIIYKDKQVIDLTLEEGINILKEEERKYEDSKLEIRNNIDIYKKINKRSIEELKSYKKYLEEKYLYESDIEEVKYYINKNGILNDFIVVDTPGLNQTLKSNTKERMIDYYNRADGVIWILDAQNIVAKSSEDLIEELIKNYIIDDNFNNIICIINKIDTIKEKYIEKIRIKVEELYKNKFKDIVLVSSKKALNGYINENLEDIELSNIKTLLKSINDNFKIHSEEVQIKAKYNLIKISSFKINKYINNYKRELYLNLNKYEEEILSLNENIEKIKLNLISKIDKHISINNLTINNINNEILNLENYINNSINNLYISTINLYTKDTENIKSTNIYKKVINISKSKELFQIYKTLNLINIESKNQNIFKIDNKLLGKKSTNNKVWILKSQIDRLKDNIKEMINRELLDIKTNINHIRDNNFRYKYTDYNMIEEHIKLINNISNNIKIWEEYYGKYI